MGNKPGEVGQIQIGKGFECKAKEFGLYSAEKWINSEASWTRISRKCKKWLCG